MSAIDDTAMPYQPIGPDLAAVDTMRGLVLLDFGTDWCGHCMAARRSVDAWIEQHGGIEHLRIEDGPQRPLGRAYRVKLWPTLVLLRDGTELSRVVRPREARELWPLDDQVR